MLENNTYKLCKLCGRRNVEPSHFWKEHHLKESDYCYTNYPKLSKATGELIIFKNREFYFNSDFNNKNELKKWLKENPTIALHYATSIIHNRFTKGKLKYAPSQVEMRSICAPNILWYQKLVDYNDICSFIGLKERFNYNLKLEDLKINPKRIFSLIVDTREQKPLDFEELNIPTNVKKLDYGDYASEGIDSHVFIERKSLPDFISTVSGGYDRFTKEINRAKKNNHYLVILVEAKIGDALAFNMLPQISRKIKASPDYIFYKVRQLMQEHDNIQFVFADGRVKAAELVKKIYCINYDVRNIDLQFLIDSKIL